MDPATPEGVGVARQVISELSDLVDQNSAERQSEAAGDILVRLFSDCDGYGVKRWARVVRLMSKPIDTRRQYIRQTSQQLGIGHYTADEWQQWLSDRELQKITCEEHWLCG